jgi:hypothetical protein
MGSRVKVWSKDASYDYIGIDFFLILGSDFKLWHTKDVKKGTCFVFL